MGYKSRFIVNKWQKLSYSIEGWDPVFVCRSLCCPDTSTCQVPLFIYVSKNKYINKCFGMIFFLRETYGLWLKKENAVRSQKEASGSVAWSVRLSLSHESRVQNPLLLEWACHTHRVIVRTMTLFERKKDLRLQTEFRNFWEEKRSYATDGVSKLLRGKNIVTFFSVDCDVAMLVVSTM